MAKDKKKKKQTTPTSSGVSPYAPKSMIERGNTARQENAAVASRRALLAFDPYQTKTSTQYRERLLEPSKTSPVLQPSSFRRRQERLNRSNRKADSVPSNSPTAFTEKPPSSVINGVLYSPSLQLSKPSGEHQSFDSASRMREPKKNACKKRPTDNKSKTGGSSGPSRGFIPWCRG